MKRAVTRQAARRSVPQGARPNLLSVPWNSFLLHDARKLGDILPSRSLFQATITSPPYWNAKDYGRAAQIGFRQSRERYWADLCNVFVDVWHRTAETGSLWVVVNTIKQRGRLELLPFELVDRLGRTPGHTWNLEDVLIWAKPHTLPYAHRNKLPDHFEYILCFGRSRRFSLDLDEVRSSTGLSKWWVQYPERYHPRGKTVGNVWEAPIPTQGTWGNRTLDHSCPLPVSLVQRIIRLATRPGDAILDPFAGSGSSLVAAALLGRRYVGFDVNPRYVKMFSSRLLDERRRHSPDKPRSARDLTQANLKLRQLKYGVQLFKRLASTVKLTPKEIPAIQVLAGTVKRTPSPWWVEGTKITLVFKRQPPARLRRQIEEAIRELAAKPPLSKYQVQVYVTLESVRAAQKHRTASSYSLYRGGRFWVDAGRCSLDEAVAARPVQGMPNLLSDIRVSENGTRWGEDAS